MKRTPSTPHNWTHQIFRHEFVDTIPETLQDATLYVSFEYGVAVHKCACGCSNEVVTPISPGDWKLTYNGEVISLYPSIGNYQFPCRSHYWFSGNTVITAYSRPSDAPKGWWDGFRRRINKSKRYKRKRGSQ